METIDFTDLVYGLIKNRESEYVEFKTSNDAPNLFGETVSALANGAVLADKQEAYLVYGVDDNHIIVGTDFNPYGQSRSQPFINLIATQLNYADNITYKVGYVDGKKVVVVVIPRARLYPVEYKGVPYIRVDSAKKKLHEHPELARKLWEMILKCSFEDGYATDLLDENEIFNMLDFQPYYSRRNMPMPDSRATIIEAMLNDGILVKKINKYYVTNLGALLFAKNLSQFNTLINREVRVIKYGGKNKIAVERSLDFEEGYAVCMDKIFNTISLLLPHEEYMDRTQRKERVVFSDDIIRELLANTLIHQDFSVGGYYPRIEIYNDRIEFTNSGVPIIEISRFLDLNRSRNPKFAKVARFLRMCEERGMGIDKVEYACENLFLPSPAMFATDGITRIIVSSHKNLRQYSKDDRVNVVYMHCCLQFISQQHLTNESLRLRFPDNVMSPTVASRWISEALRSGLIVRFDASSSKKNTSYIPFWAR